MTKAVRSPDGTLLDINKTQIIIRSNQIELKVVFSNQIHRLCGYFYLTLLPRRWILWSMTGIVVGYSIECSLLFVVASRMGPVHWLNFYFVFDRRSWQQRGNGIESRWERRIARLSSRKSLINTIRPIGSSQVEVEVAHPFVLELSCVMVAYIRINFWSCGFLPPDFLNRFQNIPATVS